MDNYFHVLSRSLQSDSNLQAKRFAILKFCDFASGIFGNCGVSGSGDEILLECLQDYHQDYNAPID